jgi:hypothetical protein
MIEDLQDALIATGDGKYCLRGKVFEREEFGEIVVSTDSPYGDYAVEQVRFVECSVSTGRFSVYGASRLSNVTVVDLDCKEYSFHSDNQLDNVSVSGGAGSILWLRAPFDKQGRTIEGVCLRHPKSPEGVCLDLSAFRGEVSILNADPKNIRINAEIHVVCERKRLEAVDWRNDAVLSKTTFGVMLGKARLSESGFYIGSIIDKSGNLIPSFDVALEELRRRGLVD